MGAVNNTCSRQTCPRPRARHSDLCFQHGQAAKRAGLRGMIDACPVQNRIADLIQRGWRYSDIAHVASVSPAAVRMHALRQRATIRATVARKVLAVTVATPLPLTPFAVQDATGFLRRVQALAGLGWRYSDLAERLGCKYQDIAIVPERRVVSRALHVKMVDLYNELQHTPGPSKHAAAKAKNKGWWLPADWENIDDPAEDPMVTLQEFAGDVDEVAVRRVIDGHASPRSLNRAERDEAARILLAKDCTANTVATRLGMSHHHVKKVAAA